MKWRRFIYGGKEVALVNEKEKSRIKANNAWYDAITQLPTPANPVANRFVVSWDASANAEKYSILVGTVDFGDVTTTSIDLSSVAAWENLADGAYTVYIIAKAATYNDSVPAVVQVIKKPAYDYTQNGTILNLNNAPYEQIGTEVIIK